MFSDVHFKYYSSIPVFNKLEDDITYELKRAEKSIYEFLIPLVEEYRPDVVVCCGDVFHNLNTNYNIVISRASKAIFALSEKIKQVGAEFFILNGNHDIINKSDTMIDVFFPIANVVKTPLKAGELYFIPFLDDVGEVFMEFEKAKNSDSEYIFAHTEIKGFRFNKSKVIEDGISLDDFEKYVFSGHIHIPQKKGNVFYIGSLYQNSVVEFSDIRQGALIFENGNYEFISNKSVGVVKTVCIDSIFDEDFIGVDAVKLIITNDDANLDEVKDFLNEKGVLFWTQKVIEEQKILNVISDVVLNTDDVISTYIEYKYPELEELKNKYISRSV
jgi:DNA repair exonuclease SbcCD nuclease subunit